MPRYFSLNRNILLRSVEPHLLPWIRSIQPVTLETEARQKHFTVSVANNPFKELELSLFSGFRTSVSHRLWKHYLAQYLFLNGATDLRLYRDIGPLGSYLLPVMVRFLLHLRNEECLCFAEDHGSKIKTRHGIDEEEQATR